MKVMIVGGGGREHALAWKAAQSDRVDEVLVAPGNAGTAGEPKLRNVDLGADIDALLALAERERVGLTIVGPEAPLVDGIVDRFSAAGLACFGPTAAAAQLEGSKAFTKAFCERHRIPTAAYRVFDDPNAAAAGVVRRGAPIVIKADGLAAGKGVTVAASVDDALAAVDAALSGDAFGEAGRRVVIEDCLVGEEASFIALCDGHNVLPFATSQDHKRIGDGDTGANTGGMGAYSPAPVVTDEVHEAIMQRVMLPTVRGMAAEGHPYRGFLYAGLMIDATGQPHVIEFNCRFGDPEAEPIMLRMRSDLVTLCERAMVGELAGIRLEWDPRAALGVVMASRGYPGPYPSGEVIEGLEAVEQFEGVKVFHAGTRLDGQRVVTSGGRVLCVTALGESVGSAQARAYRAVEEIHWSGAQYRTDIGYRAVAREAAER